VVDGAWGSIGAPRPWIAIEPVGLGLRSARNESEPPASAMSYEVASGRPFDAAVTRTQQAVESIGSLSCLSLHSRPSDVRWPVLFVTREPGQGPEQWITAAERELERGDSGVVLLEAGGQCPGGERTLEVTALARVRRLTHLPIVVDVPRIAQRSRDCAAIASAAIAAGASGVILRVWVGREGDTPRASATLTWETAVALVARLRAVGEVLTQ
jgi:3-deoxy-D-arabino-heptulosonate 7-phosphate (DAHP) synthase